MSSKREDAKISAREVELSLRGGPTTNGATKNAESPQSSSQMLESWKKAPLEVFVSIRILQVSAIDESNGTFDAQFLLMSLWRDLDLPDGPLQKKKMGSPFSEEEVSMLRRLPKLDFPNMLKKEDTFHSDDSVMKFIPLHIANISFQHGKKIQRGDRGILCVRKVSGSFLEQYELMNFPFDRQNLHIIVCPVEDERSVKLRQFPSPFVEEVAGRLPPFRNHVSPYIRQVLPGFDFHYPVCLESFDDKSMSRSYSTVEFNLVLVRRPEYYKGGYYLTLVVIQILALLLFGIEPDVSARMEGLVGLTLTVTALKFTMTSEVPKVPYRTLLDNFMDRSTQILLVIAIETMTLTVLQESDVLESDWANKVDYWFGLCVLVLFVMYAFLHMNDISRCVRLNESTARYSDLYWLLAGGKDAFKMYRDEDADCNGVPRKVHAISKFVDFVVEKTESLSTKSRSTLRRFAEQLRIKESCEKLSQVPKVEGLDTSHVELLTRVLNGCKFYHGEFAKHTNKDKGTRGAVPTRCMLDRDLPRLKFMQQRNSPYIAFNRWNEAFKRSYFFDMLDFDYSKKDPSYGTLYNFSEYK